MSLIKITLATGEVREFPFGPTSTITVESTVSPEPTITQRQQISYSDVVAVEITEGSSELSPAEEADLPGLWSPEGALFFAKELPVADAAAHVEKALARFPDDNDLLQVQAELDEAVRSGAETWSTELGEEPAAAAESESAEVPEPTEAAKALAAEQHVALWNVTGTGADGRVTKDDVERYLAERGR